MLYELQHILLQNLNLAFSVSVAFTDVLVTHAMCTNSHISVVTIWMLQQSRRHNFYDFQMWIYQNTLFFHILFHFAPEELELRKIYNVSGCTVDDIWFCFALVNFLCTEPRWSFIQSYLVFMQSHLRAQSHRQTFLASILPLCNKNRME